VTTSPATGSVAGLVRLERSSPVPLYFQVAQALRAAIDDGRLPPGSRLDNEIQLADDLGLSRPTMRRAMEYLVNEGLLVRRRGIGTRVVQPTVRRPLQLTSLFEDLESSGQRPTTTVLSLDVVPAVGEVAEGLGVEPGTPVHVLVRLRGAAGVPIARMVNHIPTTLPGLGPGAFTVEALERQGLYQILRAAGVRLHAANQTIGARRASAEEARVLGESRGAAVLTVQRVAFDDQGRTVEHASHIYAATRYSFSLSLLTG
jgi:DNA-binding GntR family transcriptional regulator